MNIVNLNQVCKIVLVNRKQTTDIKVVEKSENIIQWFKNLFRKDKIRIKCFKYRWSLSNDIQPMDKLEEFLREYEEYSYNPTICKSMKGHMSRYGIQTMNTVMKQYISTMTRKQRNISTNSLSM